MCIRDRSRASTTPIRNGFHVPSHTRSKIFGVLPLFRLSGNADLNIRTGHRSSPILIIWANNFSLHFQYKLLWALPLVSSFPHSILFAASIFQPTSTAFIRLFYPAFKLHTFNPYSTVDFHMYFVTSGKTCLLDHSVFNISIILRLPAASLFISSFPFLRDHQHKIIKFVDLLLYGHARYLILKSSLVINSHVIPIFYYLSLIHI